ncbi:MAG TPA: DUF3105 domain-containing protein [Pseudonocardiaceae bacterium]|jgi:hypothetical protein|nr:DUF3105 domain-containing protein [Pseudonocardiaceae bacterium]
MPSGKSSKAVRNARSVVAATKPKPWGTVAAVLAVLVFAVGIFGYLYLRYDERRTFTPTAENKDPSAQIEGVVTEDYSHRRGHVSATQRVAYDHFPPFGGPHDATWAACNGVVYDKPVRNENMVHPLEHGAVWITYNPDHVTGDALQALKDRVEGQGYLMLSPYPGLDTPISLQSWGHQLKLSDAKDKRIDQFIQSLRLNEYTYPEVGASCDVLPSAFDPANPPPFVAAPPGPGAVPLDYSSQSGSGPMSGAVPPAAPAPGGAPPPAGGQPAPGAPPAGQ